MDLFLKSSKTIEKTTKTVTKKAMDKAFTDLSNQAQKMPWKDFCV